jgi:hypothetical protein
MKWPQLIGTTRRAIPKWGRWVASVGLVLALVAVASCSQRPTARRMTHGNPARTQRLSRSDAAQLAASLANQECERHFKRRPFQADQFVPVLEEGYYRWGRLEVGAPGGYSAMVSFREDGTNPRVQVYLSTDVRSIRLR